MDHSHCQLCIQPKLCKYLRDNNSSLNCEIVPCPQKCFVDCKLHECKIPDHLEEVCPNTVLPCINALYGCSAKMKRSERVKHLNKCPANVVVCSAVWNRYLISENSRNFLKQESKKQSSLTECHDNYQNAPLDIACAKKDQREVIRSFRVPHSIRKMFCDEFYFRNHPLLPVPVSEEQWNRRSASTDRGTTVSQTEVSYASAPWNSGKNTPGLSDSVLSQILPNDSSESSGTDEMDETDSHLSTENLCPTGTNWKCLADHRTRSKSVPPYFYNDHSIEVHCVHCKERMNAGMLLELNMVSDDTKFGGPETRAEFREMVCAKHTNPVRNYSSVYDDHSLVLSVVPEFFSIHKQKPRAMFSFACGETVHRSEFASHYQNVHCDVYCGLDGWLMSRCPMFYDGCDYSETRRSPKIGTRNGALKFSELVDGFGVEPLDLLAEPPFNFKSIPDVVLCKIGSYLDGFTLNSLSLTCKALRNVAEDQLNRQGLVKISWAKNRDPVTGKTFWKLGKKQWFFSKQFCHVADWEMKLSRMSAHLKECKFYDALRHEYPFKLIDFDQSVKPCGGL